MCLKHSGFQMALTFQQILTDAGKLVNDMADQENAADSLLCEIQAVYTQVDSMKQVGLHFDSFDYLYVYLFFPVPRRC